MSAHFVGTLYLYFCGESVFFLSICLTIKLHESLPSVTNPEMNMSCNFSFQQSLPPVHVEVGATAYFMQWWLQQKHCKACSFLDMLHVARKIFLTSRNSLTVVKSAKSYTVLGFEDYMLLKTTVSYKGMCSLQGYAV